MSSVNDAVVLSEPPAYAAPIVSLRPSISDLRAQILANASILRPSIREHRPPTERIEIIVAKVKAAPPPSQQSLAQAPAQHYALIVQRTFMKTMVKIILKGHPRNTVAEALENLLDRTETMTDEMVSRYGKPASDTCSVM